MGDVRLRMVLIGLVLGVVIAVAVAAQGCGRTHHGRRTFHGTVVPAPPAARVAPAIA